MFALSDITLILIKPAVSAPMPNAPDAKLQILQSVLHAFLVCICQLLLPLPLANHVQQDVLLAPVLKIV